MRFPSHLRTRIAVFELRSRLEPTIGREGGLSPALFVDYNDKPGHSKNQTFDCHNENRE
jgi:hypothetical protein